MAAGGLAAAVQQLGPDEAVERLAQLVLRHSARGGKAFVGELPPQYRRELRDGACRAQPVEARHERVLQRVRDRDGAGPARALEDRLGQLFREQRHAVALLDQAGEQLARQAAAGHARHQRLRVATAEPVEPALQHWNAGRAGRDELGPRRQDDEYALLREPLQQQAEQVER